MKFTLTIDLGNDAMQTYADLRAALKYVSAYTREYRGRDEALEPYDNALVRDVNGNTVGGWTIE